MHCLKWVGVDQPICMFRKMNGEPGMESRQFRCRMTIDPPGAEPKPELVCLSALPRSITRGAQPQKAANQSAGIPGLLRGGRALPSLRTVLLHRRLATGDDQAVSLSSALTAYGAVPQSRTTARLAWRRQFFVHLESQNKGACRWSVHPTPPRQHTPDCQRSCTKLVAKGSLPARREAAAQRHRFCGALHVAKRLEFARPIMRRGVGFDTDQAWRQRLEVLQHLDPPQLLANHVR